MNEKNIFTMKYFLILSGIKSLSLDVLYYHLCLNSISCCISCGVSCECRHPSWRIFCKICGCGHPSEKCEKAFC